MNGSWDEGVAVVAAVVLATRLMVIQYFEKGFPSLWVNSNLPVRSSARLYPYIASSLFFSLSSSGCYQNGSRQTRRAVAGTVPVLCAKRMFPFRYARMYRSCVRRSFEERGIGLLQPTALLQPVRRTFENIGPGAAQDTFRFGIYAR